MVQQLRSIQRLLWTIASVGIVYTLAARRLESPSRLTWIPPTVSARSGSSAMLTAQSSRNVRSQSSFEGFNQLPKALRDSIVQLAQAQIGAPYEFGGASPEGGFDCSGLVRYVLSQVALNLPRTARQQALAGDPINRAELKPGDLLTFGSADSVTHVGIYVGGGKYVHASSVAGRVIISPLDRPPAPRIQPLAGARRLLANSDPPAGRGG
jgi:cell wall-associated NlpC family hydrolase